MRVAAAQSGPVAQRAQPTPQPIGSVKGFVLNFGLSGGMNPSGDAIAANDTWWCAASYLQSLGAQWGFTPGCRRPAGVDMQLLLPEFPFVVDGHASTGFDSIALWYTPALSGTIQWLPQVSTTMRTCWDSLCDAEIWFCVYIPPSFVVVSRKHTSKNGMPLEPVSNVKSMATVLVFRSVGVVISTCNMISGKPLRVHCDPVTLSGCLTQR